jgi:hypothetical protein
MKGTYHKCENNSQRGCLSYSRLILDTVNLLPFYKSMKKGDATEIEHSNILYNAAIEIMKDIDKSVGNNAKHKSNKDEESEKVRTLEALIPYLQQMCLDEKDKNEIEYYVKLLDEIKCFLHCYYDVFGNE